MTIRDMASGDIVDVEDDGRRITFKLDQEFSDDCCNPVCDGDHDTIVLTEMTFDKAELLAMLSGGK